MQPDSKRGLLNAAGQYKFDSGTSFEVATSTQAQDDGCTYGAVVPPDWCFGPVAFGGFVASLLTRTVAKHIQRQIAEGRQKSLATILETCNILYLGPVLPGPAQVKIEQASSTKHFAHFKAALHQGSATQAPIIRADATITFTSPTVMHRSTFPAPMVPRLRIPKAEMFPRNEGFVHIPRNDTTVSFYKFKPGYQCVFHDTPSLDARKMLNIHHVYGPSVYDVWWKFDEAITGQHLGMLVDITGPILYNYEEQRKSHWVSTRQMSFDIVRAPLDGEQGWEWLFCRMELVENVGDRFWLDVTVADEDGNVVCIAKHQCVGRPFALLGKAAKNKGDGAKL